MRGVGPTLLALLALFGAPSVASAQALEAAQQAELEGRLVDAHAAYVGALEGGGLSADETARAHLRLGVLARAVGLDDEAGRAHFVQALAIEPESAAPAELSPDERAAFEALRGLSYRLEIARAPDSDSRVRLRVLGPDGAASLRVALGGASRELALEEGAATLEVPLAVDRLEATVLDAHGNALHAGSLVVPRADLTVTPDLEAHDLLAIDCPASGDPCEAPIECRPADAVCAPADGSLWAVALGVGVAALLVAAAVVAGVLGFDAYQSSLWRIDRAGTR